MYEEYTHQCLPEREYREFLGTALYVFNSNNVFVVENILRVDEKEQYTWYDLINWTSGDLEPVIKETISRKAGKKIASLFHDLVGKRNRIIHSYAITDDGTSDQRLGTKDAKHVQWVITEDYLMEFIHLNDELSHMLHEFRGC